ncbi:MAG: co-chaperone GroES [Bryobacterales bacterium]|nr:co-chaperone GroES [Acidobacteriota bacterium]MCB9385955.1 co-chaperone GroES [Bryobacterales bacterium]
MALRPLHNRIVVERSETSEQKSAGGIIIPDSAKEKPQEATVVAVGPGKLDKDGKRQPLDVKVGDRILIGKYAGSDIKLDNKEYVILTEDEVLAVVEGSADKKKAA